jgi:prolipoprotein diacylglyceryltransferase
MYTIYGLFVSISILFAFSFINLISTFDYIKLAFIFIFSILFQPLFCHSCLSSYSFAAYIATIPLLISLLFHCNFIHMLIFSFSIASAIGRFACLFAGCCSGKIDPHKSPFSIFYSKGSVIADHLNHSVYVYPTILFEIFFEFLIAFFVLFSKYGLILYGVLNFFLLILTSWWRYTPRMNNKLFVPLFSLVLFTIIVHFKQCYQIPNIQFIFKPISIPFAFLGGLIVSNDIHIQDVLKLFQF